MHRTVRKLMPTILQPNRRRVRRISRRPIGRVEQLEQRALLAFDPSPQAQEMLEHVNRMRMNPQGELQVLFTNLSPLTARDPDADFAIKYFRDPTTASIQAEWPALRAVAPLAWSESLTVAATAHSNLMIQHDMQSHQLPGEQGLGDRIRTAGYSGFSAAGENVFAYSKNAFHAHSSFALDWAVPSRGHRENMMSAGFRDFGVGMVAENSPATSVGPLVVTQNFGNRFDYGNPFMVGVVFRDGNGNQRYDAGEGLGGVTVQVSGPSGTFTTTTMSAGGYQLRVPGGSYTVTASGGGLTAAQLATGVQVASANVKVDFRAGAGQPAAVPSAPGSVVATAGDRQATVRWTPPVSNGGAALSRYEIQASANGGKWTTVATVIPMVNPSVVLSLQNGIRYTFQVAAVNVAGRGAFSAASNAVTPQAPVTTPAAPAGLVGTPGNGRVMLSWERPRFDGNSTIIEYRVQSSTDGGRTWLPAGTVSGTRTSMSVAGLTNGVDYRFRVAAVNRAGVGAFCNITTPVKPVVGVVTPIDLAAVANQRLQSVGLGAVSRLPEGNVTLGGVRFAIPVGGNNVWTGLNATGTNPRILDVAVNASGVRTVHTLINTLWGERDAGARASITFFGSAGATHTVNLDGDVHIRDYLWNTWTNRINGTSTVNVFNAGSGQGTAPGNQVRLDMQRFDLPEAFANQVLTRIRISDWGGTMYQRLIVSGITVR